MKSFFFRAIRYVLRLIISMLNIPYELGIFNSNINILTNEKTIALVADKGVSCIRIGDGELELITGSSIPFQKYSPHLSDGLTKIITKKDKKLLICLPPVFSSLKHLTLSEQIFWRISVTRFRSIILSLTDADRVYGSSFMSRPYLRYKDKHSSKIVFIKFKQLLNKKRALIIEGSGTSFGVNNDLLENCNNVSRILCPSKNAYSVIDNISKTISKVLDDYDILLFAVGPTSKILIHKFFHKIQCIDVGHLDVEYEWYLRKTLKRIDVGKDMIELNKSNTKVLNETIFTEEVLANIS